MRPCLPEALKEAEVAFGFAGVIEGGGAGEESKPAPECVFAGEGFDVLCD